MRSVVASGSIIGMLPRKEGVYRGSVVGSILELADRYLRGRDVSRAYAANLRRTARKLAAAGITTDTIDGEGVSHWLSSLKAAGLSSVSVASERRSALTLWKFGIEADLITTPIRHVLQPRVTRRVTRAFRRDDLTRAVKSVLDMRFKPFRSGCPRGEWLAAWITFVYETGARFTDAYELRSDALIPGGVAWTASKTGQPVVKRLSRGTENRIRALAARSPDGTVFRWAVSRRHAFAAIRSAFEQIGLEHGRTQWLRRSGATHAEIERGKGAAAEYLAHATPGLAERHYIDRTQLIDQIAFLRPLEQPSEPTLD